MRLNMFLAATAVSTLGVAAQAAVLDFEDGTVTGEGTAISNQYQSSFGVTFSGDGPKLVEVGAPTAGFVPDDTPDPAGAFGQFFLGTNFDNGQTDLTIDYDTAVDELRFQMGDIDGPEEFDITAFNGSGGMVDFLEVNAGDPGTGNQSVFDVVLRGMGIKQVQIVGTSPGQPDRNLGIAFDNFNPSSAVIPLPAGLPLLAGGLAVLGVARRRSKA